MTTSIAPAARQQFSVGGVPLAGGLLFTYAAGTTSKLTTYTDYTGATANTNPIVLDSQGQCDVWLTPGTRYKFVLSPPTDTDPPTNPFWTKDNLIAADPLVTTMALDTFSGNGSQTAFTLSAAPTSKNNTLVYVGGQYQSKSTYSVSGSVLTFNSAPASGTNNIEVQTINQTDYGFVLSSAAASAASALAAQAASASNALTATTQATLALAAAATSGVYPNSAATNVPQGLTQASVGTITAGSGGTNGTFALGWSGGNFAINPSGTFIVAGGVLTAVTITGPGQYIGASPSIPTPSFAASTGLTGAAVALTIQYLVSSGNGYWAQSSDGASLIRYKNVSGVATLDSGVTPIPSYQADTAPRLSRTIDTVRGNDGSFIAGTRADGLRVRWNNPSGRRVYTRYIAGKSQVFIADQYGESQLTYTGNNTAPEICVSQVLFTSDRRGYPEPYFMGLDGTNQTPAATQLTEHWTCTGQSLMTGDQCASALSTSNVDSRAQMLSLSVATPYGPRTHIDANPAAIDSTFDITKATGLTALVEAAPTSSANRGETICSGFSAQYLKGQPTTEKIVIDNHARGAATYNNDGSDPWLAPSSNHFANGLLFQELVRKYVEAGGGAYRYAGMLNIHGHADAFIGTSRATYAADIQAWRTAYNQQTRTRSTLHRQQPMFISQMSNMGYSTTLQNNLNIAFAQMDAHQAKTGVFLIGAAYLFNTVDGTHLTAAGNRQHGEYFGKVVRRVMKEGVAWEPLYPKSWTRSGSVINIVFNVPVAPLVFDTSIVSDPGNGGFTYIADTADGISVSSVALGSDGVSVNVTLSGTAFGTNPRFRIAGTQTGSNAGPTTGARSTLRDSDNEKGVLSGLPLYNYACIFEGAIV